MTEIYICTVPTVSGATDGKCTVYFAADYTTVSGWCDEKSIAGATNHRITLDTVFGQDYQSVASDAESGTTSSTYLDKVSLTTPALTGTYLISWQTCLENSSPNKTSTARLENVTDSSTLSGEHNQIEGANDCRVVSGFGEVVFTGSAKTFKIQWKTSGGTATTSQSRITIWRIG